MALRVYRVTVTDDEGFVTREWETTAPESFLAAIPWHDEHTPYRYRETGDAFCRICSREWPCPDVRGDT